MTTTTSTVSWLSSLYCGLFIVLCWPSQTDYDYFECRNLKRLSFIFERGWHLLVLPWGGYQISPVEGKWGLNWGLWNIFHWKIGRRGSMLHYLRWSTCWITAISYFGLDWMITIEVSIIGYLHLGKLMETLLSFRILKLIASIIHQNKHWHSYYRNQF
jgi:hypothetical protein